MTFLAVTAQTWMVTCLGFCMVLVLLCVFVFLMKGLGAIMQLIEGRASKPKAAAPKAKVAYATDANEAEKAAIAMTLNLAAEDPEKAAVAYALHLYYNSLHDVESPRLTLISHATAWSSKGLVSTNL